MDCYLLNNSIRSVGNYDLIKDQRNIRDTLGANKLYENIGNRFLDISTKAGIYTSSIGFGLGVTIGDVNADTWPDVYVSNDFFERDYLYINNQDGTFTEALEKYIRETSLGSMGADMADLNNDGYPEIFVTDMLPRSDRRFKTKTAFENWDKYRLNVDNGYYHQFTRNVLQLNNGNSTFSEVGRLSGVHATDWSWGALIADFDNDGLNDLFVANGIYKDLTDQDYINFMADANTVREILKRDGDVIKKLVDMIPSEPVPNYVFKNKGNIEFEEVGKEWGLSQPSFSNGSAYGDIDNDGDLDLVTNNANMPPFVYRNNTDTSTNTFLSFTFEASGSNTFAQGVRLELKTDEQTFYREQNSMKGFQSTVDNRVYVGLGNIQKVDSIIVTWPDGRSLYFK